ncbi:hypothetical protein D8674_027529 [Pyrus ussuriensis x Pyrus communis]|uniref:Uncharacterized protein n=1 Tax=Pyrus ussuriensis x Pyrus communis TaxID=2448454 RepID=A0A5N5I9Y5_9ROSA|nr:hypothetical protein D8674_027529 [Pyrus ussuriensis x Pyrus communis]
MVGDDFTPEAVKHEATLTADGIVSQINELSSKVEKSRDVELPKADKGKDGEDGGGAFDDFFEDHLGWTSVQAGGRFFQDLDLRRPAINLDLAHLALC